MNFSSHLKNLQIFGLLLPRISRSNHFWNKIHFWTCCYCNFLMTLFSTILSWSPLSAKIQTRTGISIGWRDYFSNLIRTVKQKLSSGTNNCDVETYRNKLGNIRKLLQIWFQPIVLKFSHWCKSAVVMLAEKKAKKNR